MKMAVAPGQQDGEQGLGMKHSNCSNVFASSETEREASWCGMNFMNSDYLGEFTFTVQTFSSFPSSRNVYFLLI